MKTPTKQTAHRLAAVLAIATAIATGAACAADPDPYYWTGATSTDYNTAENWSSNHVAVAPCAPYWRWPSTPMYFETADIVSYRINFGQDSYARGHWYINTGTEAQPLEFYCANGKTLVSPDCNTYNYASGLNIALTCDSWVWINGGKWDEFAGDVTIGSSDYAGHLIIGNDRGVDTLFKTTGYFRFNQGSIAVSNATVNIDGKLIVGNTAGKLTSFDFCNSTMVVGDYFEVKNSATFDLCGGSITNAANYLTVDYSGEMTIRNGGRYACQAMFIVGNYSAGTLNIIDGGEAASGTRLSLGYRSGSSGTVNIASGGILTVPYIHLYHNEGSATVALDGGTIRAAKDGQTLIQAKANLHVTVGANGGTIDAAGYNVTIAEDLDNASGATGAMTFKGGGTVTLSGAINYTGGTTVEAGTVVVVPSVAKRTALGAIAVTGLENNICEVVRLSGEGTFSAGDLPTDTETVTFAVSPDGKSILAANGLESPFWIGGSGDLGAASNWSGGVVPTENPTIKWSSPITLTNSGGFAPNTLTIPDDSAVVTLAGALTVNCLTNASKLAVASTGSLTVTGDMVVRDGKGTLLYSNEGTVRIGRAVCTTANNGIATTTKQYEVVTANTQPIRTGGFLFDRVANRLYWRLESNNTGAGAWVVGADGFAYGNIVNEKQMRYFVQKMPVTLYSSADWTLHGCGQEKATSGELNVYDGDASLTIDTSDYDDPTTPHTVTLEGRILAEKPVTIKGCGTVEVNTTGAHAQLPADLQHTCLSNATLSVTESATLKINEGRKITGNGKISLAAGTTLSLDSSALGTIGDTEFTPCIPGLALPAEGTATIRIDGARLRSGDYVIATVAPGTAANVTLDPASTALVGRKGSLRVDGSNLVLTIVSPGLSVFVR